NIGLLAYMIGSAPGGAAAAIGAAPGTSMPRWSRWVSATLALIWAFWRASQSLPANSSTTLMSSPAAARWRQNSARAGESAPRCTALARMASLSLGMLSPVSRHGARGEHPSAGYPVVLAGQRAALSGGPDSLAADTQLPRRFGRPEHRVCRLRLRLRRHGCG